MVVKFRNRSRNFKFRLGEGNYNCVTEGCYEIDIRCSCCAFQLVILYYLLITILIVFNVGYFHSIFETVSPTWE